MNEWRKEGIDEWVKKSLEKKMNEMEIIYTLKENNQIKAQTSISGSR